MKKTIYKTEPYRSRDLLKRAKEARRLHDQDCPLWDYEGNNGCQECDRLQLEVERARERVKAVQS